MKWTFDFLFTRIYFFGGLTVCLYSFIANLIPSLPAPGAGVPPVITGLMMGLLLMMIGANMRQHERAWSKLLQHGMIKKEQSK